MFSKRAPMIKETPYNEYHDAINQVGPNEAVEYPVGVKLPLPPAPKPTRPGDTAPRAYVGIARDVLSTQMDKHTDELVALDKDIEKLTEERRQVRITIDAIQTAIAHMNSVDCQQSEFELEAVVAAEIDKHVFGDK